MLQSFTGYRCCHRRLKMVYWYATSSCYRCRCYRQSQPHSPDQWYNSYCSWIWYHQSRPSWPRKPHVIFDVGHADMSVAVVAFSKGQLTVKRTAYDRNPGVPSGSMMTGLFWCESRGGYGHSVSNECQYPLKSAKGIGLVGVGRLSRSNLSTFWVAEWSDNNNFHLPLTEWCYGQEWGFPSYQGS